MNNREKFIHTFEAALAAGTYKRWVLNDVVNARIAANKYCLATLNGLTSAIRYTLGLPIHGRYGR